jgi:Pentapeptide repeats (8 copies)
MGARLDAASLIETKLEGADLRASSLQGARVGFTEMLGASLEAANLHAASFENAFVWGVDGQNVRAQGARFIRPIVAKRFNGVPDLPKYLDCAGAQTCDWSVLSYSELKTLIETQVPAGVRRDEALARIQKLDPE